MRFVKIDELKIGMKLARPIFNQNGIKTVDRNAKLSEQLIDVVKGYDLPGVLILDAAESAPKMLPEEVKLEQFQVENSIKLSEELDTIMKTGKDNDIFSIVDSVIRCYGRLDIRINFYQNHRSLSDFVCKHSLNVAILVAMIANKQSMRKSEMDETVIAALTHDIGKLNAGSDVIARQKLTIEKLIELYRNEAEGHSLIRDAYETMPEVYEIADCASKNIVAYKNKRPPIDERLTMGTQALIVAETFDTLTSVSFDSEPMSAIAVVKMMLDAPKYFDERTVMSLVRSINIISEGSLVLLSNGDKATVVSNNKKDVFKPTVLNFRDNTIMDLSDVASFGGLCVVDEVKSLDNRYLMG